MVRISNFLVFICSDLIGLLYHAYIFSYLKKTEDGELKFPKMREKLVSTPLLLLYAEVSVFLGEWVTDKMLKKTGYRSMYLAYGANILAVLIFALYPHMAGMLAALVLMGLSACFGKAVQQMYFLDLTEIRRFGADKAMGVYNFTENIGESLGPVIFGELMFRTPLLKAVLPFSGCFLFIRV